MSEMSAGGSGGAGTAAAGGGAPGPGATPSAGNPAAGGPPPSADGGHGAQPQVDAGGQGKPAQTGTEVADKKYKLRIGKQEREVSRQEIVDELLRDLGEDGVLDLYKLRKGAYEKFEKAKSSEDQVKRALSMFKQGLPGVRALLREALGPQGAEQVFEQWSKERAALAKMTPEQRQQHEERRRFEMEKQRVAAEKQQIENQKRAERAKVVGEQIQQKFTEALTAAGLPANRSTMARMAIVAREAAKKGVPRSYADIAKEVQGDIRAEFAAMTKALEIEQLREFLGDEAWKQIRTHEAERLDQTGPVIKQPRGEDGKFVPVKGNALPGAQQEAPKRRFRTFAEMREAESKSR